MTNCILTIVLSLVISVNAYPQNFTGLYIIIIEGQAAQISLNQQGNNLTGLWVDSDGESAITGVIQGNMAGGYIQGAGTANLQIQFGAEIASPQQINMELGLMGIPFAQITLQKQGIKSGNNYANAPNNGNPFAASNFTPHEPPAATNTNFDLNLAGSWINSENLGGSYGSGYMAIEKLMYFGQDGSFEFGASRSYGGGSSWSYDGSTWSEPEYTGRYITKGNQILLTEVNGQTLNQPSPICTYFIDDNKMAITYDDGKKVYFARN